MFGGAPPGGGGGYGGGGGPGGYGGGQFAGAAAHGKESTKLILDMKIARLDKHMYTDGAPETWHKNIRSYLLGRHSSMKPILDAVEKMGDTRLNEVSFRLLVGNCMSDLEPDQVNRELWSWLSLTLEKSSSAQRTFHNVPELQGAEVDFSRVRLSHDQSSRLTWSGSRSDMQVPTNCRKLNSFSLLSPMRSTPSRIGFMELWRPRR